MISSTVLPRLPQSHTAYSLLQAVGWRAQYLRLVEPMHLARTLCTPITSKIARIGPPAIMRYLRKLAAYTPWRRLRRSRVVQSTLLQLTLTMLRRASSIAFVQQPALRATCPCPYNATAAVTDHGQRRESHDPTALDHFVTRLTPIIFSCRPSPRSS